MKWLGLGLIVLALAGCQASSSPSDNALAAPAITVAAPQTTGPTDVELIRQGGVIQVGDAWDKAKDVFPEPRDAFEFSDLPKGFGNDYKARGWETARQGFGVITFDDKIVSAMFQDDDVSTDRLTEILDTYTRVLGRPATVESTQVRYWFYEKAGQRLMICAESADRNTVRLTEAMGDDVVLNALGIGVPEAQRDSVRLRQILEQQAAKAAQSRKKNP